MNFGCRHCWVIFLHCIMDFFILTRLVPCKLNNVCLQVLPLQGCPILVTIWGLSNPAIAASQSDQYDGFYFLADYHALIKCQDPQVLHRSTQEIAAIWLALGLNTDKVTFYRQSDIVEIPQLCWLLNCMTAKGLMNRSHAYKAAIDDNLQQGDHDQGISMGLFSYPILMAADILLFNAHYIPVGKDQIQHIEMCRDIAARFNKVYQPLFNLPQAMVAHGEPKILSGLDGRKMSKSYGNIIPLFAPSDQLRKLINQIYHEQSSNLDNPKILIRALCLKSTTLLLPQQQ